MRSLRLLLEGSMVPEDVGHAGDTLRWLLRLRPDADWALRFAAQAHDVDRALPDSQRVHRCDFRSYESFKAAHARNSARVAAGLLRASGAPPAVVRDVARLVLHHERTEADERQTVLCDADALSFFTHNLPYYLWREGWGESMRRACWGVSRLSRDAWQLLAVFPFADPRIRALVRDALARAPGSTHRPHDGVVPTSSMQAQAVMRDQCIPAGCGRRRKNVRIAGCGKTEPLYGGPVCGTDAAGRGSGGHSAG